MENTTDVPVDSTEAIKELLVWVVGTNVIIIACLLILIFFAGKAGA